VRQKASNTINHVLLPDVGGGGGTLEVQHHLPVKVAIRALPSLRCFIDRKALRQMTTLLDESRDRTANRLERFPLTLVFSSCSLFQPVADALLKWSV